MNLVTIRRLVGIQDLCSKKFGWPGEKLGRELVCKCLYRQFRWMLVWLGYDLPFETQELLKNISDSNLQFTRLAHATEGQAV